MTDEQKAAFVFAQAVAALATIESMKAANHERRSQDYADAYDEADFVDVEKEYCIGHNAVLSLFQE